MAFEIPQFMQDRDRGAEIAREIEKLRRVVKQLNEVKVNLGLIYTAITDDASSAAELVAFATTLNTAANGNTYNDFITWLNSAVN